jgi:hypothetical protein
MKNKRDNDLIWEAFIAENVPGIGGMFSLNDDEPELDDPSTRSRADDAFTQKGALVNNLQHQLNGVLEEIEIAGRDLDKSAILDLVNWFESRVKNILDE